MPDRSAPFGPIGRRERGLALGGVLFVQLALGGALISGLQVNFAKAQEAAERLIAIGLPPPPVVPPPPPPSRPQRAEHRSETAPVAPPAPPGGTPGPAPAHAPPSVTPVVAVRPVTVPSGGGSGSGPALGSGAGGGSGGQGFGGDGGGGTDLELISGEITPRDYPKHLGNAGIGGRVTLIFTVGTDGRARQCRVERSSGIPELDALTCRLIERRFRFRPSTDRFGRPIPDEIEWDHDWIAN